MPRGDGTGPAGAGPMTGRGAGYCSGFEAPGYANPGPGWGMGMGYGRRGAWGGRGRGWRNRYYATGVPYWARHAPDWGPPPAAAPRMSREQEVNWLKAQADNLKHALQDITDRLGELEQE